MTIVNIRGPSGSGKTTLVKTLISVYREMGYLPLEAYLPNRKRPIYTVYQNVGPGAAPNPAPVKISEQLVLDLRKEDLESRVLVRDTHHRVAVMGHYEIACGGCDTISSYGMDAVFRLANALVNNKCDLIFEGLMLGGDKRRLLEMMRKHEDMTVLSLLTPFDECLEGVRNRRQAKKPGEQIELADSVFRNMQNKFKTIESGDRYIEAEFPGRLIRCTRDEALEHACAALGLD